MKKILAVFALGLALSGCGDNMPPKCDSKDTTDLLYKVFYQQVKKDASSLFPPAIVITGQKMIKADNKQQTYLCQATVSTGKIKEQFNYSVFLDPNNKEQFFVQIVE